LLLLLLVHVLNLTHFSYLLHHLLETFAHLILNSLSYDFRNILELANLVNLLYWLDIVILLS